MKLALGTAQFGMPYGIANTLGQIKNDMAPAILDTARKNGMDTIDTAIGYADSETVLGRLDVSDFRVITKLSGIPDNIINITNWVNDQINASLSRLRINRLAGVLLHRPDQLMGIHGPELADALAGLKHRGIAEKIGVSIYNPDDLPGYMAVCSMDLVQAPFNLIDRRLANSGWLDRLQTAKVEVHVRSIFLQGLLLMAPDSRPAQFARWKGMWRQWDTWVATHGGIGPVAACIAFGQKHEAIDRLVVGVDTSDQLKELVAAANRFLDISLPDLSVNDEELINPAYWAALRSAA